MTTQIHKFHTRDTEEQLYDVPLHDVELNDVANVRHKSASSCVPSWLHGNLAHYLMLFPRKAYKHKMPAWVWICTLHGCPPHHVVTNLSLSMYHKQPRIMHRDYCRPILRNFPSCLVLHCCDWNEFEKVFPSFMELGLMDGLDGPLLRVLDWCNNDQHLLIL